MSNASDLPNEGGLYCLHGKRLMVSDLAGEYESYPPLVFVDDDEWPCPESTCTRAAVEEEFDREAAEYEAARWLEYRNLTT
jgi:hypothetical protein